MDVIAAVASHLLRHWTNGGTKILRAGDDRGSCGGAGRCRRHSWSGLWGTGAQRRLNGWHMVAVTGATRRDGSPSVTVTCQIFSKYVAFIISS
jgi:hypothetical protein